MSAAKMKKDAALRRSVHLINVKALKALRDDEVSDTMSIGTVRRAGEKFVEVVPDVLNR